MLVDPPDAAELAAGWASLLRRVRPAARSERAGSAAPGCVAAADDIEQLIDALRDGRGRYRPAAWPSPPCC